MIIIESQDLGYTGKFGHKSSCLNCQVVQMVELSELSSCPNGRVVRHSYEVSDSVWIYNYQLQYTHCRCHISQLDSHLHAQSHYGIN